MSFDEINSPEDLKGLSIKELEKICSDLRQYMITCCASNPGHLGASLGAVEIACALHYCFNAPEDKIIWDVGHQAYAHKILTGRREAFKTNRKYKGLSGFPKMSESKYDAFGTGHSSTSISAALGMAVSAKLQGKSNKVVAVIGDGALTGGMAFEAMNNAGSLKADMLVILNDNRISIDENTGALHNHLLKISTSPAYNNFKNRIWNFIGSSTLRRMMQKFRFSTKLAFFKSGSLFESLGFRYFGTIDGNNLSQLITTIENIKDLKGPILLHVITKKGKGYAPAEKDSTIWHAPGTFDPVTGIRTGESPKDRSKYQDVFGETLLELARKDERIVAVTPAMVTGCSMNYMMHEMPDRTFDVGIAEPHAVTFSAGLAASGMLPVCNIYSSFMQRAYDNIIHDCALQNLKMIFCIDRGGIVGEDGATHHGAFDLAYLRPVPNLCIASPKDELQLRNLMYSATCPEYITTAIRYPRGYGEGVNWRGVAFEKLEKGKAELMNEGSDLAVLSIGPVSSRIHRITMALERKGIHVLHYNMIFLKPIDKSALEHACTSAHTIITVEDATIIGGLHSAVSEYVADNGYSIKVVPMGIPDRFIEQGSVNELLTECGYSDADIERRIEEYYFQKK